MKRILVLALAMVMVCSAVIAVSAKAEAKPVKLKCITFHPPKATTTRHFMIYFNEINKRGKGKIVLEYLGGREVIPRADQPMAAVKGLVDMVFIPFTFYGGLVPIGHAMQLTAIGAEEEMKKGVWEYVRELHAKSGLYWIGRAHASLSEDYRWNSTKKISTLADIKGQRAGSGSTVAKPLAEALGASFTQIQSSDVFTALERGVLDSYIVPPAAQVATSAHKVCKYIIDHGFYRGNLSIMMGLKKWNSLPKDVQDILNNTLLDLMPQLNENWIKANKKDLQKMRDAGEVEVKLPTEEAKIFQKTAYLEAAKDVLKKYKESGGKLLQLMNPEIYESAKNQ